MRGNRLQEAAKAASGVTAPVLTQADVERAAQAAVAAYVAGEARRAEERKLFRASSEAVWASVGKSAYGEAINENGFLASEIAVTLPLTGTINEIPAHNARTGKPNKTGGIHRIGMGRPVMVGVKLDKPVVLPNGQECSVMACYLSGFMLPDAVQLVHLKLNVADGE